MQDILWPIGSQVDVTPTDDDIFHDFSGRVIGHSRGFIQVRDQDDNVFDVDAQQLEKSFGQ